MKKLLSLILAAVLLFAAALPALAEDDYDEHDESYYDYTFTDGAWYTHNGERLGWFDGPDYESMFRIADGTRELDSDCLSPKNTLVVVFPDSVTLIPDDVCDPDYFRFLHFAGSTGSAAQQFAAEHDIPFTVLGEGHEHEYFYLIIEKNTCVTNGYAEFICPCGDVQKEIPLVADESLHEWETIHIDDDGNEWQHCAYCDGYRSVAPCSCFCHKLSRAKLPSFKGDFAGFLKDFIFRLKLVLWRLTGQHQYCECGARHY